MNNDQEVAMDGRENELPEEVQLPLIEQSPKKLMKKLQKENFGVDLVNMWSRGNGDRNNWLTRQEAYLLEYDEFIQPIVNAPAPWAADLHLPVALTVGKTFHARFFSAIMGAEPIVNVKARKAANEDRTQLVSDLMNYAVKSWANDYNGIEAEIDSFVWNWAMRGVGILKMGWDTKYSRILDVVKKPRTVMQRVIDPATGEEIMVESVQFDEVEEEVIVTDCNAPRIKRVAPEDLLIVGGDGDIDSADAVMESCYLTASDLWTLVDQGVFDADVVEEVIKGGDDKKSGEEQNGIKTRQAEKSGQSSLDKEFDLDRYHILECYIKKDVDGSGINSDIVVWVHKTSQKILRATYLHRINRKTKKRPYAKADFYIREGQVYGVGLIELTYSLCKEIDSLNNMAMDFGLLSTMPFGYYRSSSSLANETIPVEPGTLVPVDDPSAIYFPTLGARHTFSMQHLQFLYSIIEKLTGISDLNLGVIGGQGAARTASGVQAIMAESNNNLDIFLRRLNRAMKKAYKYLFATIQEKLPAGLEFRLTGDDGKQYFRQVQSREEIAGDYDFDLEPNSANSNPGIRLQNAQSLMQVTGNPLDIQLGIITPLQRYEALKNYLVAMGIKDYGRFLQKPAQMQRSFTPEEMANRILAGIDTPIDPAMDLGGFIEYANQIISNDELLGQFTREQAIALVAKQKEAAQMMQALQQQQAQVANAQQMQQNAAMSTQQTVQNAAPGAVGQASPQGPE